MIAPDPDDALAPVRAALVDRARADARHAVAAAERDAERMLADARATAEAIRAEARREGAAEAAGIRAVERARARRAARAVALAVRREVYEDFRSRVVAAVRALRGEPNYPDLREHLAGQARAVLGADAPVREDPAGGVVATGPGRRVDCTLDATAEQALAAFGVAVEGLWAP